jgi:hypothetical protein
MKNKDNIRIGTFTPTGFWIGINNSEYFCEYTNHPWFRQATPQQIHKVEGDAEHLFWDEIDVDLSEQGICQLASITRTRKCTRG